MRKHLLLTLGTMLTLIATAGLLRAVAGPTRPALPPAAAADAEFLMNAAMTGAADIQISQLALQKTTNERVKALAARIETGHQQASAELTALARRSGTTVSAQVDPAHQAARDRLERLSGTSFDRAYAQQMIADHEAAIALFTTHAKTGVDAEVRAFAAQHLPALRAHLKQSQDLLKGSGTRAQR